MADAKKLSSMDASFLYLETPEMPMHVGSMAIFRLPDDYKGDFFEDFKAMIASRLHVRANPQGAAGKRPRSISITPPGFEGRPVRYRPPYLPRQPSGTPTTARDTGAHRRLDARKTSQSGPSALGVSMSLKA